MFSDALFGHRRGAFTGATEARDGLVHQAAGGTLFLDEIGDLSIPSQIKLLRLLDTREYYPLGSDLPRRSDARVVVATNRDLRALMAGSSFRRDLFFRLSTHELAVPPLRERRGDLALLLDHFLDEAARALGRDKATVSPALLALLDAYHFPGNVRELRSLVFDAASRQAGQELPLGPFKAAMGALQPTGETGAAEMVFPSRLPTLKQATELLVVEALRRSKGNQSIAAAMLGVSHQALSKRVRRGSAAQGLGAGREGRGATRGITALPAAPGPSDDSPPPRTKPVPPRG
jgi:DNA-binding NtrC family response regulator